MQNEREFNYTYSAKEQNEIKAIRDKYAAPPQEDKLAKLRRLDAGVVKKASSVSLVLGIIGALLMGTGMSLVMTELDMALGISGVAAMVVGIAVGAVGILLVSLAYPLYGVIVKKERQKIAPEIMRLTDELIK